MLPGTAGVHHVALATLSLVFVSSPALMKQLQVNWNLMMESLW